jgi:hypothetical protein
MRIVFENTDALSRPGGLATDDSFSRILPSIWRELTQFVPISGQPLSRHQFKSDTGDIICVEYRTEQDTLYVRNARVVPSSEASPSTHTSPKNGRPADALDRWRLAAAYFDSIQPELSKDPRYDGKFIALQDKSIIDSDADEFQLARRVLPRYPDDVIDISKVQHDECETFEVPSPELVE